MVPLSLVSTTCRIVSFTLCKESKSTYNTDLMMLKPFMHS